MVLESKLKKATRTYLIRMEEMTLGIKDPVGFHPPAQEWGSPGRQQVGTGEPKRHTDHTEPQHQGISDFGLPIAD